MLDNDLILVSLKLCMHVNPTRLGFGLVQFLCIKM